MLVTTYELCMMDAHFLSRFEWGLCIVDEAHRLKSQTSKLYERERTCDVPASDYGFGEWCYSYLTLLTDFTLDHKLLLTGTPVQVRQASACGMLVQGAVLTSGARPEQPS